VLAYILCDVTPHFGDHVNLIATELFIRAAYSLSRKMADYLDDGPLGKSLMWCHWHANRPKFLVAARVFKRIQAGLARPGI